MAKQRYAVEITQEALKSKHPFIAFMAGGQAVELNAENSRFETDDPNLYASLRDMPGLKALGEVTKAKDGEA